MFGKFCQTLENPLDSLMSTMNISLPGSLKSFVDQQVSQRGYSTSSEYVRELIRKDQDRLQLRDLLLSGGTSAPGAPPTPATLKACATGYVRAPSSALRSEAKGNHSARSGSPGCR